MTASRTGVGGSDAPALFRWTTCAQPGVSARTRSTSIGPTPGRSAVEAREVLLAPAVPLGRVVAHAGLLVLLDRPEQRVLVDPGLVADRGDGLLALARVLAVHHREHRVRPVLVGRTAVAVAHEREARHLRPDLVELALGHGPDAHGIGLEAGVTVVHHRGEPAHQLAFL